MSLQNAEAVNAGSTFRVRPAEARDREAVFALAKAFATSFVIERCAFETSYGAVLQSSEALVLLAEEKQRVVGYLLGFDHDTFYANGRVAWVEEIMVAEEVRRHGIGRQLMAHFEAWAKARQARLVGLATRRAAGFYRQLGYEESAVFFRRLL